MTYCAWCGEESDGATRHDDCVEPLRRMADGHVLAAMVAVDMAEEEREAGYLLHASACRIHRERAVDVMRSTG